MLILVQVISKERFVNTNTINLNITGSSGIYFGTMALDFTLQGKPAEQIIAKGFE